MEMNNPSHAPNIEFTVDAEHSGVRTAGCFTFLIGSILSFVILNSIIPNGGLITVGVSLAVAIGLTYLSDNLIKRFFPSNRYVQIFDDVIRLAEKDIAQHEIDASQNVNLLMWHFEAPRHPRVPKGWYVVANALEQDGEYIVTYSIASPEDLENLPLSRLSTNYVRKKNKSDDESRDLRKAGNQRRIQEAEFHRGEFGAEMSLEDYRDYLDYLVDTYTTWMPKDK